MSKLLDLKNTVQADDYNPRGQQSQSLQNTDFFRSINQKRVELMARVSTLRSQVGTFPTAETEARNTFWFNHWQKELAAVLRALHTLGAQQ